MSGQKHPDTEALASLQAGLIGGLRGRRLKAHMARCARCASVSDHIGEVSSMLASVPAPALPEAFQSQITAAIAAEAAAREGAAGAAAKSPARAGSATAGDSAEQTVPTPRPRHARTRGRRPGFTFRPAMALVPMIALLLAGFGYLLSRPGSSSSSSSALSEPAATAAVSASASGPELAPQAARGRATFSIVASGTNYQAGTLRAQVLSQMAVQSASATPVPSSIPSAGASGSQHMSGLNASAGGSGSANSTAVSPILSGCVLHLTGNVQPSLVDLAKYEGKPAYVIAVPDHAWVVGLGCTASKPDLLASVAL